MNQHSYFRSLKYESKFLPTLVHREVPFFPPVNLFQSNLNSAVFSHILYADVKIIQKTSILLDSSTRYIYGFNCSFLFYPIISKYCCFP